MDEGNLAILVDAKTEYTKQLVNIISPNIFIGLKKLYNQAKEECSENNDYENTLYKFQILLSDIPKWNQELIIKQYEDLSSFPGYDIQSFDKDGNKIFIEVKATKTKKKSYFEISENEINAAKRHGKNYHI